MKYIVAILAALAALVIFYAFAAFVAWDANPGAWSIDGRFTAAMVGFPLGALAATGVLAHWKEKRWSGTLSAAQKPPIRALATASYNHDLGVHVATFDDGTEMHSKDQLNWWPPCTTS